MNSRSLAHNIIKNQESSWTDDPFQFGTHAFKGLGTMSHERNLYRYTEDLVTQNAKFDGENYNLSLSSLPESEQNELVRLLMESTDRETSECVYGDDFTINSDFTCSLLAMLKNDNQETRERFADVTRKNILTYYSKSLQKIINEVCTTYHCNMMLEQDYHAQIDRDHGDVIWRKI